MWATAQNVHYLPSQTHCHIPALFELPSLPPSLPPVMPVLEWDHHQEECRQVASHLTPGLRHCTWRSSVLEEIHLPPQPTSPTTQVCDWHVYMHLPLAIGDNTPSVDWPCVQWFCEDEVKHTSFTTNKL